MQSCLVFFPCYSFGKPAQNPYKMNANFGKGNTWYVCLGGEQLKCKIPENSVKIEAAILSSGPVVALCIAQ